MIAAIAMAVVPAAAQSVLLDDFDGAGVLTWTPSGDFHVGLPAAGEWSGNAAICTASWCYGEAAFVAAQTELSFVAWADESGMSAISVGTGDFVVEQVLATVGAWDAGALDLTGGCGKRVYLDWGSWGDNAAEYALDDVVLGGAVCAGYADEDGDGLCAWGRDLDGDGACTTPLEAEEHFEDMGPIDCDDSVPGAGCPVVVDDFDNQRLLTWTDESPLHSGTLIPRGYYGEFEPQFVEPWDQGAGVCLADHPMGGLCMAASSSLVVTHGSLSVRMVAGTELDSYLGVGRTDAGSFYEDFPAPTVSDVWEEGVIDVSAACGRPLEVDWYTSGSPTALYAIDDLTLEGTVCAAYLDLDGDGACPAGNDLDGDGQCLGAEASTVDQVVDCDDDRFGFDCLSLVQAPPILGQAMLVTVIGAVPGEVVGFAVSETAGTTCPSAFGGSCFDLGRPLHRRRAIADASGSASVSFTVPSWLAVDAVIYVQAVAPRGGVDAVMSNLASDRVSP